MKKIFILILFIFNNPYDRTPLSIICTFEVPRNPMNPIKKTFFNKRYPQNYLVSHPLRGAVILFLFSFLFTLLYHPLDIHRSFYFGFEATMLFYTVICAIVAGLSLALFKRIPFFRSKGEWTVFKEILFVFLVLLTIGITVFLLAFVIEEPAETSRWNLPTFIDSVTHAILIFIFPFAFFSLINARFLFLDFRSTVDTIREEGKQELVVHIDSSLKKESLDFRVDEFVFAMADGNYVMFHLYRDQQMKKIPIRNSISDIEHQLEKIPMFFRCHRGFIINMNRVVSKQGNASGYMLKMNHTSDKVPVSRNRIREFDRLFSRYHS